MSLQDSTQIENVKVLLKVGADGRGIAEIVKVGTSGVVDTYDIVLSDGTRFPFDVTNGSSIATIEKTATVGLVDTYTITLTNGDTFEFEVTNADGSTAGTINYDNTDSGLDATNVQDAIDEVNDKVDTKANKTDLTSISETGATASQAISNGTYFYLNGTLVRAKTDIASGATFTLNTNYEVVTVGGALDEIQSAITTIVKDQVAISDLGALSNGASGYKSGACPAHSGYIPVMAVSQVSRVGAVGGNLITNCSLSGNTYFVNYKAFANISADNSPINVYIYYQKL
jgi:hypothetical protein